MKIEDMWSCWSTAKNKPMETRTFVIDQGNTMTKVGIFEGHRLVENHRVAKGAEDEVVQFIRQSGCNGGIVSSVRSDHGENMVAALDTPAIRMDRNLPLPFKIDYHTPQTLGVDRLANAAGALRVMDAKRVLIIDCGSCLTTTLLEDRILMGGSIAPGLRMRFEALAQFTGQLPLVEPHLEEVTRVGKTTDQSIRSGVQLGILAEIKEIIAQHCSPNEPLSVIMTGGDASYFVPWLKSPIFAEPFLTLMGLHEIYHFQLNHT